MADYSRDQQRRGLSPATITRRRLILRAFYLFHDECLTTATTESVETWLDALRLSPRSRCTYLSALHGFYDFLRRTGVEVEDPTRDILRPRVPRLVPRPISDADLDVALTEADFRMRAWLTLAAFEGFRCKEIALLQRSAVMDDHDPPLISVDNGKGGHQAILPLNPLTHLALLTYGLPRHGYVFTMESGRPYKPGTISSYISRYLHGLGIDATAHRARHWFGTAVWAATKDLRVTQEMLRHSDPQTTAGYTAFDAVMASAAVMGLGVGTRVLDTAS
jgi:site-specific recombinase XerD